jgi:argininosuccinate lyase / amino-acid N-acetyltransferase
VTTSDLNIDEPPRRASLWSGRFSGDVHDLFKVFNDSLNFDRRLFPQELAGSAAWARALERANVLEAEEVSRIEEALEDLARCVADSPAVLIDADDEDIHSFVERELVARVGDLGKKLHTGRSRNDQVATDLRLWTMEALDHRIGEIQAVITALVELAHREQATVFPGYTHLQRAQPVLFAHWCLAYVEMLRRDLGRMADAQSRASFCPLGCAALAGTAYDIDREAIAVDLGFRAAAANSLDAVSDRDFVIESLSGISVTAVHLSRMAEDLVFYSSGEARLIELPDGLCSGSSIMPQKKNPDALELIRGKCGMQIGRLVGLMTTMKALPLAYNKDMQEDKVPLFDAMDELSICLRVLPPLLDGIKVRRENARVTALGDFSNATELADHLVARGVPFRDAHHQVGRLVAAAIERGLPLEELSLTEIQAHAPAADEQVFVDLTVDAALGKRASIGGTSPEQIALRIARLRTPTTKSRPVGSIAVRTARVSDLADIKRLVDLWADAGENLPRSEEEILQSIGDFTVATEDDQVVGCGALWLYTPTLAEIRSVGVDPKCQGSGVGSRIVEHLAETACKLRIEQVFVLTRAPRFFERLQFKTVSVNGLPEKILKDCARCPKKHCCDEIAMIRTTWAT